MASRRGNGGEPVSPAAVAASKKKSKSKSKGAAAESSASSSTDRASAAAAGSSMTPEEEAYYHGLSDDEVRNDFVEAGHGLRGRLMGAEAGRKEAEAGRKEAEARLSARDAPGTLLSLLLLSPVGLVTRLVAGLVETIEWSFVCDD
jgi:hypothetical protein